MQKRATGGSLTVIQQEAAGVVGRGRVAVAGVLLIVWMLAAPFLAGARAQPAEAAFAVDVISVRGEAAIRGTRVDIYTRTPYTALYFLRTADGFTARYEISVAAYHLSASGERQYLAERQRWMREVRVDTYTATRAADRFDASMQSMALRPGSYLFVVRLSDAATAQTVQREIPVEVRDLSGSVAVSDLILLDDYEASTHTISPRVAGWVSADARRLQLFYEVYTRSPREVRITQAVVRRQQGGGGLPVLGALLGDGGSVEKVTYTQVDAVTLPAGRTPHVVTLPIGGLPVGTYLVRTRIESMGGRLLAKTEKRITVRWTGLNNHVQDLDAAIAQLHYIAEEEDLTYIRSGDTKAERRRRFEAFWKKRDPTPDTERNERMLEYYYRVARANDDYGGGIIKGWTTDRGHVLVLFGPPDRVERHPASARPYQVWHYDGIDRRFIFVDEDGTGSYTLVEPVWDESSRIR